MAAIIPLRSRPAEQWTTTPPCAAATAFNNAVNEWGKIRAVSAYYAGLFR